MISTKTFLRCTMLLVGLAVLAPQAGAQGMFGSPSAAQCQRWAHQLAAGGQQALNAVTNGAIMHCPSTAPSVLSIAIRGARNSADTAYLGRLAAQTGQVRDAAVFGAAIEVAGDSRASDRSRIMALLVTVAQLGSGQEFRDWKRPDLFTRVLPTDGVCGFGVGDATAINNGLLADADRRAARVIDPLRSGKAVSSQLENFARCARSAVDPDIPVQVDTSKVRLDHVCGTTVRIQNHTGVTLLLSYVVTNSSGATLDEADVEAPAKGGWTAFEVGETGQLVLQYDRLTVAVAAATPRACRGTC